MFCNIYTRGGRRSAVAAEAGHLGRSVWNEAHRSRSRRRERDPRRRGAWESTSPRARRLRLVVQKWVDF